MNRSSLLLLATVTSLCFGSAVASACPNVRYNPRGMTINTNMSDCAHQRPAYGPSYESGRRIVRHTETRRVVRTVNHGRVIREHGAQIGRPPVAAYVPGEPCLTGYKWYPGKKECIELYAQPRFAEKARCIPGETREIDDPARPGYKKLQTCGFAQR